MNALKLVAVALAVACSAVAAQNTTTTTPIDSPLTTVSLLQLVNEAKAAVASNPDLAALFANIGDVTKLSDAELQKLVKDILAVKGTGSGSLGSLSGSLSDSKSITTAPAPATTTAAPVVAPTGSASSVTLAPAAALALVASVVYTLL